MSLRRGICDDDIVAIHPQPDLFMCIRPTSHESKYNDLTSYITLTARPSEWESSLSTKTVQTSCLPLSKNRTLELAAIATENAHPQVSLPTVTDGFPPLVCELVPTLWTHPINVLWKAPVFWLAEQVRSRD